MIYFNFRLPDLIYKLSDTEHSMWMCIAIGQCKYTTKEGFHIFELKDSEKFIRANRFVPYKLSYLIENFNTDNNNTTWKTEINNILEYLSGS